MPDNVTKPKPKEERLWPEASKLVRRSLRDVNRAFARYAALAHAGDGDRDWPALTEAIHDVRVASRRAKAALDAFRPLCEGVRGYASLRRAVAQVRRDLGEARDWDIFLAAIPHASDWHEDPSLAEAGANPSLTPAPRPDAAAPDPLARPVAESLTFLRGFAVGHRLAAQADDAIPSRRRVRRLKRQCGRFAKRLRKEARRHRGASFTAFGWNVMAKRRAAMDDAVAKHRDAVAHDPAHVEDSLHRVRIAAKKYRYAVELFAEAWPGDGLDALVARLKALQVILGHAQDARVTRDKADALAAFVRANPDAAPSGAMIVIEAFRRVQTRAFEAQCRSFAAAWEKDHATDAPGASVTSLPH